MGKEEVLPPTKAETAEQRLEELASNKSVTNGKIIFPGYNWYSFSVNNGEFRAFPDGFETIESSYGMLYLNRRTTFIYYNLKEEREKQNLQDKTKNE